MDVLVLDVNAHEIENMLDMDVFDAVPSPTGKKVSYGRRVPSRKRPHTVRAKYVAQRIAKTEDVDNEFFVSTFHPSHGGSRVQVRV